MERVVILGHSASIPSQSAELEETVPGVKVMLVDGDGKGCKHLITDMTRLYDHMRAPKGRWKKPQGAEWYILGRDQAKFMSARSGLCPR